MDDWDLNLNCCLLTMQRLWVNGQTKPTYYMMLLPFARSLVLVEKNYSIGMWWIWDDGYIQFFDYSALAGLRVGYGAFPLSIIEYLWRAKQPYNVSVAAEIAACAALENPSYLEVLGSLSLWSVMCWLKQPFVVNIVSLILPECESSFGARAGEAFQTSERSAISKSFSKLL